jgi:hypothetical protein
MVRISESATLEEVHALLLSAIRQATTTAEMRLLQRIDMLVARLLGQVERGVHVNPELVTFGLANPRGIRRGARDGDSVLLSNDVQAIVYRHAQDDQFYAHGFGDAPLKLQSRDGALTLRGLRDRTGVELRGLKGGRELRVSAAGGQPVWAMFDEEDGR